MDIEKFSSAEGLPLPTGDLNYMTDVVGITKEEGEMLNRLRPSTLGAAKALPHLRPSSLLALMAFARSRSRSAEKQAAALAGEA